MADTVEQVYVWDGNDWVPVVRDETVSNTSELTNDGEDGVNPFITAADIPAVPDKKLPIDSADGTVVLDSTAANNFSISTGGAVRFQAANATNRMWQGSAIDTLRLYAKVDQDVQYISFYGTDEAGLMGYRQSEHAFCIANSLPNRNDGLKFLTDTSTLVIEPTGWIETTKIVGSQAPSTDAAIELGANFSVSTAGVERLRAGMAVDDSGYLMIGDTPQPSIPGISIGSKGTGIGSQMQLRFVDVGGNYSYVGATQPSFNAGSATALLDGGVFFAGSEFGDSLLYARGGDIHFATGGLSADSERLRIADTAATFTVDIKTSRIVGRADNDASIELGVELLTSNHTPTQPNSIATKQTVDDKIWVGTTSQYQALATKNPTTLYCLTD